MEVTHLRGLKIQPRNPRKHPVHYLTTNMHTTFFGPAAERRPGQVFLPTAYRDILAGKGMVSIIESDGELSKEVAALVETNEIPCICFDPTKDGCPFFNPLVGRPGRTPDQRRHPVRLHSQTQTERTEPPPEVPLLLDTPHA